MSREGEARPASLSYKVPAEVRIRGLAAATADPPRSSVHPTLHSDSPPLRQPEAAAASRPLLLT